MRLACSASRIARKKGIEVYSSMPDLVEKCYGRLLLEMGPDQVATAKIVSILGAIQIEGNLDLERLERKYNLAHASFLECCSELHSLELIDAYKGMVAVAPGDQVLRDYLLYKVVYIDRDCCLAELHRLENGEQRCASIVQTILSSYWSEELQSDIERQLKEIWDNVSDSCQWEMIARYGSLLANCALLKISCRIRSLPSCEHDYLNYSYCSNASSHRVEEKSLSALIPFLHQGDFGDPEELFFMALERGIASPDDMKSILVEKMSFGGRCGTEGSFSYENKVLDCLAEGWKTTHEAKYGMLASQYIATLLAPQFDGATILDGNTVYFSRGELVYGEEILSLRRKAIGILFEIRQQEQFLSVCDSVITEIRGVNDGSESGRLWRATLEIAYELYISKLESVDKASVSGFALLEKQYRKAGIEHAGTMPILHSNSVQDAITCLFACNTFPEEERLEIRNSLKNLSSEEVGAVIREVVEISGHATTHNACWKLPEALRGRMEDDCGVDDLDPESIIPSGISARDVPGELIRDWINRFGAMLTREKACRLSEDAKNEWLREINSIRFCYDVDEALISDVLSDASDSGELIEFDKCMKAESYSPGFYSRYCELILSRNEAANCNLMLILPSNIVSSEQASFVLSSGILPCVSKIVLSMIDNGQYCFDENLIRFLVNNDNQFIENAIPKLVANYFPGASYVDQDPGSLMGVVGKSVWDHSDGFEMAEKTWQAIMSVDVKYPRLVYPRILDRFISGAIANHADQIASWLLSRSIVNGVLDDCFADAGMNLPSESRLQFVVGLCEAGIDPEELKRLPFLLTHRGITWTGSEVPVINERLNFIDEAISLLRGIRYVEYRKVLEDEKLKIEGYRNRVELNEFLGAQ